MNKQFLRFTFFLLMYLTLPLIAMAQVVDIPDPNLRTAIEAELGKASGATITTDEMTTLTELTARSADISDLAGLEHATHLTRLELVGNKISVVSVLANLTNLESLFLDNNRISDISPLVGLTKLTRLGLEGNNISDISALADLTDLIWLRLEDNYISDISPLAGLTKLDTLIGDVQQFYADEMERHGFEGKTFTFETDENGRAMVHHVDGQFTDSYYHQGTFGKVSKEIAEKFDMPQHIYMVAIDVSNERIGTRSCGEANRFWDRGGREFIIPASGDCFNVLTTAHELGHAFGLDHDFRNDAYIMSYGITGYSREKPRPDL